MTSPKLRFQQDISSREFLIAASLGLIAGVESVIKFGHCPNAASDIDTDVWERGGTLPIYLFPPDAGEAMELVGDAADVGQSVLIDGLDGLGLPKMDTKVLNGAVPVALEGVWSSIHRICNRAVEGDPFTADVVVRGAGGGTVYAVADDDDQQTSQAMFKVPSNRVAAILNFSNAINAGTGGPNASAVKRLKVARKNNNFQSRVYFGLQETGTTNLSSDSVLPLVVGPWTRLKAQATPDGVEMDISSEYSLLLIDTDLLEPAFIAAL